MNKLIVFVLLLNTILYCQLDNVDKLNINYEIGTSLESSILLNSRQYSNVVKSESSSDIYPISIYLIGQMLFSKSIALEIKPGIILGGDYFTAFEYGFFMRYNFNSTKYFIKAGINIHDNFGDSHGAGSFTSVTDENLYLLGLYLGYQPKNNFAFTLGYFIPTHNYYYYSISEYEGDSYKVKLNHILKLGLEFTF